jgi:hypothetical protein
MYDLRAQTGGQTSDELSDRELETVTGGLNPQPLPPGRALNPQPLPPGIVAEFKSFGLH